MLCSRTTSGRTSSLTDWNLNKFLCEQSHVWNVACSFLEGDKLHRRIGKSACPALGGSLMLPNGPPHRCIGTDHFHHVRSLTTRADGCWTQGRALQAYHMWFMGELLSPWQHAIAESTALPNLTDPMLVMVRAHASSTLFRSCTLLYHRLKTPSANGIATAPRFCLHHSTCLSCVFN